MHRFKSQLFFLLLSFSPYKYIFSSPPKKNLQLLYKYSKKVQTLRTLHHIFQPLETQYKQRQSLSVHGGANSGVLAALSFSDVSPPVSSARSSGISLPRHLVRHVGASLRDAPLGVVGSLTCTRREAITQRVTQRLRVLHPRPVGDT